MEIEITIEPYNLSCKTTIETKWLNLESKADSNYFLSWQWIGNWLDMVTGDLFLIEGIHEGKVVGLGFFVEVTRKAFGFIPIKQWWLHRSGVKEQDQIWIEYNDFLLAKPHDKVIRKQMVRAVTSYNSPPEEVVIGLASEDVSACFTREFNKAGFIIEKLSKVGGYLTQLPKSTNDYLFKLISKNTRIQLSRSKKLLEYQGKLNFDVFSNSEKLAELLPKIAKIHIKRWRYTLEGSGFSNPSFYKFLKMMVSKNLDRNIEVAVLSLNGEELGYLINFNYKGKIYFYLSALEKNTDNRIKIGLTLHCEAILYYIREGIDFYDFLGGDARYKKSLSNQKYNLVMNNYYRGTSYLKLERILKSLKGKFFKY